jgi:hypothetical protein
MRRMLRYIVERGDPRHTIRRRFVRLRSPAWLGTLRRTTPLSREWGYDRGSPVDRYYIDAFLQRQHGDIRGHVLEVRDASYARRFGQGITHVDVLDIDADNPNATIVADLSAADAVAGDQFDCIILTQTLQFIYDTQSALLHAHRMLRAGGVLLVTVPVISRIAPRYGLEADYWRFTPASCHRVFSDVFGPTQVHVRGYGNVLTAMAFLTGMAQEELRRTELDARDDYFPVIIAVRAVKGEPHEGSTLGERPPADVADHLLA